VKHGKRRKKVWRAIERRTVYFMINCFSSPKMIP
jgi:hypothetical protein